jgi:hypothetical protein
MGQTKESAKPELPASMDGYLTAQTGLDQSHCLVKDVAGNQ